MPTTADLLKAALADRYRIDREIGQGGMATVYLAEDVKHRRKVAVKVLRPELAATMDPWDREPDGRLSLILLHSNGARPDTLVRPRDASRAALRADWTTDGKRFFFTINKHEGDVWTVEVR
jgi:serine/threonine protein kinase